LPSNGTFTNEMLVRQALRIANLGLLISMDVSAPAITTTGQRFQAEVLEPLADFQ